MFISTWNIGIVIIHDLVFCYFHVLLLFINEVVLKSIHTHRIFTASKIDFITSYTKSIQNTVTVLNVLSIFWTTFTWKNCFQTLFERCISRRAGLYEAGAILCHHETVGVVSILLLDSADAYDSYPMSLSVSFLILIGTSLCCPKLPSHLHSLSDISPSFREHVI